MGFTRAQIEQLLRPINPKRVLRDGKGHSHVSQQDVLAHLIRVFGFGNFDIEVTSVECVFEVERHDKNGELTGRWDCCYRAMARLVVRDPEGNEVCHYEDGSTATAQNQTRGDAHDLAYKSAISVSKKRAAIALGDQFGLSLYNRGQLSALVRGTVVMPDGEPVAEDLQEGVEQQVTLGNDEIDRDLDAGLPRNKDGSISRSRVSDEDLAGVGSMTRPQAKEHGQLVKETIANPKLADRSNGVDAVDELWMNGGGTA
ncbi:Rad52/Rad22 family DNA repair protein [Nonomuraea sp. NPDC050790]|uniref:Rad52/Rad22 family DNA repair protein n=1 Tax=Nonomuraea sp. NPDC050790 TaxID=3364371 RepID=UPI0037A1082E